MKDKIKMNFHSMNIKEKQKEKLKQLFPEVFNEEKIDFDKLKLSLGEDIDSGRERYGMNWPGKAQAIRVAQLPSLATLKPDEKASVDFDKTKNLFIEGDNLEVLKLLQKSYFGKIKMIYLDPPYNTGKEFIYPDKYEEGLRTYLQYTGQIDAEGKKFSTNVETDGRFHSKWMNMMWPRLFLARNLLKEDGAILISIDDHEVINSRKICDEIFGEENFILQFTSISNPRGRQTTRLPFALTHEYILAYAKNISEASLGYKELSVEQRGEYKLEDKTGKYRILGLRKRGTASDRKDRPNLFYPIYYNPEKNDISTNKSNGYIEIFPKKEDKSDGVWRWQKSTVDLDNGHLIAKKVRRQGFDEWDIFVKDYLNNEDGEKGAKYKSVLTEKIYNNENGTETVKKLFDGKKLFDFPKPVELLKELITFGSAKNEDVILDFFAGSATTAHAVMQLNAEDGGNRKFIMTQLPELTNGESEAFKAGYKDITEIGEERIRRAGKKILAENKGKEGFDAEKFDNGFKIFRLDKSNFSVWDGASDGDIQKKLELHVDNTDPNSKEEDILYEILVKAGFELSEKIEQIKIGGKNVYSVLEGQLLICLDKLLDKDFVRSLAEKKPKQFICLNSSFKEDADLTNTAKILENNQIEFRTI